VCVVVYDILSGKIEQKLEAHRACVRDVSWHPYINNLVSSSVRTIRCDIDIIHCNINIIIHCNVNTADNNDQLDSVKGGIADRCWCCHLVNQKSSVFAGRKQSLLGWGFDPPKSPIPLGGQGPPLNTMCRWTPEV